MRQSVAFAITVVPCVYPPTIAGDVAVHASVAWCGDHAMTERTADDPVRNKAGGRQLINHQRRVRRRWSGRPQYPVAKPGAALMLAITGVRPSDISKASELACTR